ncbi:seminal fluid protein CSSFP001 [Danaus plexippus plexippus]|uniref:beta-glucosidase n=1 Tax=Danaus plexippus plexippus TaxID=278856 RepID=A0A212EXF5_DANPL|nr:seminal fluid protein CSSFP001 [Danaus plexippus plexippus]
MFRAVRLIFLAFVLTVLVGSNEISRHEARKIPDDLLFGAATASYQIEGAWNEDGKSENIWDRLTHLKPCYIHNCDTGDIAADSYHQYKRDVEMMRELGLDFYRFSLSWTRILPTSFPDQINEKGVQYYNNLINEMLKYNIQPMVTLYHWDLPQKLQDLGGWANPHIVDWFTDYAKVVFELFGDRVKYWITVNEPKHVCHQTTPQLSLDPSYSVSSHFHYMCAKNLLVAHANVYHLYNNKFREVQGGQVGITISSAWAEPESENDMKAAEDAMQFEMGLFANPIFSESGDYPSVMKERIAAKSKEQGFPRSRLPQFTPEEVDLIKGSSDFIGLNHYTTNIVYRNESVYGSYSSPSLEDDVEVLSYQDSSWDSGASSWLKRVPWGFYKLLTKIREDYNNPPVFITENGFSSRGGLIDDDRVKYYRTYIDAMLDAIEDGSDIRVYTAWSLMDNFEWMEGYSERFGLYEVDYESPERTRTPRKSAYVYKEMLRTRTLDYHYEPDMSLGMNVDEN